MSASDNYPMGVSGADPYFNQPDFEEEEPLTDVERLAIAQAFYKAVAKLVETKNPDNLRGRIDAMYKKLYESTGAKSFDMKLFGGKVGTYSIAVTKPTESKSRTELKVDDEEAYARWAVANGCYQIDDDAALAHFELTGEMPEGCTLQTVHVPGNVGGKIKSTSLRIDEQAVFDAITPQLEEITYALLEGGM